MKRRDVLVALFITRGPLRLVGAQAPASRGEAEVRAVVERYLHGLKFNDVKSLEAAFWPDARLLFIKPDGTSASSRRVSGTACSAAVPVRKRRAT